MVFSKNYDKTLWLILNADKDNRYNIANFIRIIPKELIERIQKEVMKENIISVIEFSKAVRDDKGVLSMFKVKIDNYSLKIQLSIWNNEKEEAYELDLGKINFDKIDENDLTYVGNYYFANTSLFLGVGPMVVNGDMFAYEMYVNEDDKLAVQVTGSKLLFDYQYDKVVGTGVDSVDIQMDDLGNNSNVNRLIKRKKRK